MPAPQFHDSLSCEKSGQFYQAGSIRDRGKKSGQVKFHIEVENRVILLLGCSHYKGRDRCSHVSVTDKVVLNWPDVLGAQG